MSSLKLTADGGGGTVAIKGPASTTGNNAFELTVPGTASGTILTSNSSLGKILQVVSVTKTDTFSVSASTGNYSDITGLSASITPSASSNKILIHFQSSYSANVGQRGSFRLLRGSTVINAAAADGSSTNQTIFPGICTRDNTSMSVPVAGSHVDSPSTTSSITYKLQVGAESTASTIYVNADASGSTGNTNYKGVSNIILMEVAA